MKYELTDDEWEKLEVVGKLDLSAPIRRVNDFRVKDLLSFSGERT